MIKTVNVITNRQILMIIVYRFVSSSFFIALRAPTRALGRIIDAIKEIQNKNATMIMFLPIKCSVSPITLFIIITPVTDKSIFAPLI